MLTFLPENLENSKTQRRKPSNLRRSIGLIKRIDIYYYSSTIAATLFISWARESFIMWA